MERAPEPWFRLLQNRWYKSPALKESSLTLKETSLTNSVQTLYIYSVFAAYEYQVSHKPRDESLSILHLLFRRRRSGVFESHCMVTLSGDLVSILNRHYVAVNECKQCDLRAKPPAHCLGRTYTSFLYNHSIDSDDCWFSIKMFSRIMNYDI